MRGEAAAPIATKPLSLEQLQRVGDRLRHAPGQRNADETPGEHELPNRRAILICVCHWSVLYAPAGLPVRRDVIAAPASAAVAKAPSPSGCMWKRWCTALTNRLHKKPITNSPAMMYMVTL